MEDSRKPLWINLTALMQIHWGGENLNRLARECGVSPATATRIKKQQTSVGLEILDRLAESFRVSAHQLIDPDFNPHAPTSIAAASPMAADLARMLDAIQDPAQQENVYAIAVSLLQLGNPQTPPTDPASSKAGAVGQKQRAPAPNPTR